jgi:hypothetical protein
MKHGVIYFSSALIVALFASPLSAWADARPDFDDEAKPILKMQPGLLQYVESRFDVKDTGTAKYPGDDDRPPGPPFIFRARPLGSHGPYNLRLLIQPGEPGHILGVVDITKVHLAPPANPSSQPAVVSQPPTQPPPQAPATTAPAPARQPSEPTADTPSGPIMDSGSQAPASNSSQPSLAPPPDPAPPAQ